MFAKVAAVRTASVMPATASTMAADATGTAMAAMAAKAAREQNGADQPEAQPSPTTPRSDPVS